MASKSSKGVRALFFVWLAIAIAFIGGVLAITNFDSTSSIKEVDSGLIFNSMDVEIEWSDDRTCKITQDIEAQLLTPSHGIFIDLPVNSGEKIRNLTVKSCSTVSDDSVGYTYERAGVFDLVRIRVGDEDVMLRTGTKIRCIFSYDYITPRHPDGSDILALMAIGEGWTSGVEKATVTMTYPTAPENAGGDYGIYVAKKPIATTPGVNAGGVVWSNDGKTVTIDVPRVKEPMYSTPYDGYYGDGDDNGMWALGPYEGVEVAYKLPDGTLHNHFDTEFILTLAIGGVLAIVAILLKVLCFGNKQLSPIVDFYPPRIDSHSGGKRHMLPVQMGKIIDDNCSGEDVTSLIFYWASEGYLEIDERDGETYLIKMREISPVRTYEKALFDKIFSYGTAIKSKTPKKIDPFEEYSDAANEKVDTAANENKGMVEVTVSKLTGKLASAISGVQGAVNAEYKNKFYTKASMTASRVMTIICAIFAVALSVLTSFRVAFPMFNYFGFLSIIPVVLSAALGTYVAKNYFKLPDKKRKILLAVCFVLTAGLAILTSLVVPVDVMGWAEKSVFAVLLAVPSCIAPFMLKREKSYDEELNSLIGFRDFLRDAEKERLEMLLADDPQYYYNILPYANVLGVSDIWEKKFKDLTIEPPTYYRSNVNVFDIYVMSRLTRSFGTKLTFTPPSSSSGSRSGGGFHGGGGGGGFSGGSFGGGGGGRW